jgi:porphobilinogen synthase
MVRETSLTPAHLIQPLFVVDGENIRSEVASLPGTFRLSLDKALVEIGESIDLGINTFVLFPAVVDALKDKYATYSWSDENFYLEIIRRIKQEYPDVVLMSDVAMDPYNSDGHDGLVEDGKIVNDDTLPILGRMALAQAQAGIDIIGPSDMMDGRVEYIREELDLNGYHDVSIMSYTAKYASAFYGPFRDALDSAPKAGDKKTYQMDPANKKEALRELMLDEMEGADMVMVKPALHYLDVIHLMKENSTVPVTAYHVSGECAMLSAACRNGWLDFNRAMPETLLSIRRAGADAILTYFAHDYAAWYRQNH